MRYGHGMNTTEDTIENARHAAVTAAAQMIAADRAADRMAYHIASEALQAAAVQVYNLTGRTVGGVRSDALRAATQFDATR